MTKHTGVNKARFLTYLWPFFNFIHEKVKGALWGLRQYLATESPLKMMKNAFYFTLKVLFVLKISKFLSWLFGHVSKRLIKKVRLISIFMTSQTIVKHILHNISRSKGNQAMKFGQLIECNKRTIFLEKPYTKCGGETSPRPFSEKLILSISLNQ